MPVRQLPQVPFSLWLVPAAQPVAPVQLPQPPQLPQEQVAEQVRLCLREPDPQLPHASVSLSLALGVQPGVELQAPQPPQSLQAQVASQARVRVRSSPQVPQLCGSDWASPVAHTPSPLHTSASHSQVCRQVRDSVPHFPHAPRASLVPGLHAPSALQSPLYSHVP